jgi:hypothetical protein
MQYIGDVRAVYARRGTYEKYERSNAKNYFWGSEFYDKE